MTKVLLIYEIHDIFRLAILNHVTFPALVELSTLYSVCGICCRMFGIINGTIGKNFGRNLSTNGIIFTIGKIYERTHNIYTESLSQTSFITTYNVNARFT